MMKEGDLFKAPRAEVSAWADEYIARLNAENEEWMAKAQMQHNQAVQDALLKLKVSMENSIERFRAQNVPDQIKRMSIENTINLYEKQRDAITRQLK